MFNQKTATSISRLALFAGVLVLSGLAPAYAKPGGHKACKADVEKFCGGMERGDGRIMQCLHENRDQLSEGCAKQLEHREKMRADFQAACGSDAQQYCADKRGREMRACMKENRDKMSDQCKSFIAEKKKQMQEYGKKHGFKAMKACKTDVKQFCSEVERGEGRILACLKENEAQLSKGCAEVISKAPTQ